MTESLEALRLYLNDCGYNARPFEKHLELFFSHAPKYRQVDFFTDPFATKSQNITTIATFEIFHDEAVYRLCHAGNILLTIELARPDCFEEMRTVLTRLIAERGYRHCQNGAELLQELTHNGASKYYAGADCGIS